MTRKQKVGLMGALMGAALFFMMVGTSFAGGGPVEKEKVESGEASSSTVTIVETPQPDPVFGPTNTGQGSVTTTTQTVINVHNYNPVFVGQGEWAKVLPTSDPGVEVKSPKSSKAKIDFANLTEQQKESVSFFKKNVAKYAKKSFLVLSNLPATPTRRGLLLLEVPGGRLPIDYTYTHTYANYMGGIPKDARVRLGVSPRALDLTEISFQSFVVITDCRIALDTPKPLTALAPPVHHCEPVSQKVRQQVQQPVEVPVRIHQTRREDLPLPAPPQMGGHTYSYGRNN